MMQADGFRERSTGCRPSLAEAVGLLRLASVEPFVASRPLADGGRRGPANPGKEVASTGVA